MAERPLYTLYKNLKAQNYDVPDDYNKFESALTRDGKGGADNRHAIYENLKAQNFDVPSTYERFYSALFEPRSKTSSRAKGGSVPMSAADRARFSAGAAAISASAQQTMNNAGRYNRLKQRKQKQQKDFGRVNLGTHQTPYGGDTNNVVKDDFSYNPETGKTGAYVTSDNENVYSLPEAEQTQAILDEQNNAYQQAVDTGEIPSVLDVRDKNGNYDLQENIGKNGTYLTEEGAQKQFDKKLADAYARKKEIEAAIAEDHRLHGNPLLSYSASIGASNGRTAEQNDYSNKLATSLALVNQQIGALEAVKQYPTSSWGEDALKALDNTAFTAKTWDFGLTDFATMGQMERIKTKMDNNIPLSGSDKMLLKSKLGADAAAALEDEKMGNVYRWTKIAGQSLPFMADFFLTGGYGGITKGISRGALKFAAKRGMGKVSAAILKNTGIVAGDVIGSYAMAGTEQALKTGADIMQRHLGNLYQDEKGDYKFGTFDDNGNLLHEGGESMGTALYKGMTSAMVENYTEKLFGHNYGIKKGAVNFMEKHGMNASAEFFKNIGKSGWYTNSKKWMEKFGINGFGEEVMEEEIGIPLHALLDGDNKFSDLLDTKQQLDIIGGMAISVGSMYAMGAGSRPVKGIYNRAQYYRFRNKVNVADSDAQNIIGDNWADIKDKIDNATNEQMGSVLAGILRQRDTMTKEQINAAVNYGVNLMKMRGYNVAKTAEMNAKEITNEPTTPEEQHQTDIDNAYSEGHDADDADKHDIQIQQEDQMKTLAAALGISEQQLSAMSDEELESLTGQDDKLDQAIYDYQLSSARYQGVVDDAQDKVDLAAHQAEQRVDMYTDQSRGSVRNATIKASGGLEDYGVYIISGNIATHDDGSIDVSNSDDMILYYDPTTNSVEHAYALMFAELGEELPADDVKTQAVADAKENAIKEVAGIIDGTVEVGSQFNVTDTDGSEHTYEVLADYGDGTAAISIDGNVVENPYSLADLQQMKDLEDQKRLEAAKAEREQMEKERAAQQTQETEQSQPSFDFNQILNDNGNVVLVDVLDKDGNTKYPDSRLFLIRDAGAKAKVVELKSDGTIVPHAVSKEDVATISSMSLDEYKQAMPESSMIEDNSGEESDEDSLLENLGLPKGSEIWMSGDGFGRPKENTLSKVVGIDEQGSIILEDKDGKKWSASFDYINNHRELPPLDENTNIVNEENNQSESNAEENTPATEQTPAITLEDGTIVPMLEDGNPDFSKLTAAQTAELYDTQFGEDADSIVSGYVSDAKKALDKASNMTVKGKTFVEQKAAKDAKEKAIADAQAAYDSAIAIRDAYNERQLAKVEDTADGRKELIEKARRKFARLKSAVKDDAEAVSQLYRDTIGSLLHRLYDGTGIDVTDTTPLTAEEYVASNLGAHSLNYEGTETSKGVKQETGLSREDFAKTQLLAADGKGTTIDALVHSLWENRPSNLESLDTQDIRNALIGVLNSGFKASEARNFVENIRIAQAENRLEEQKRAQENAVYAEQHKAEPEAELKAKSDEKAELKAKSEAKLDNESSNESNDLDNDLDNEKKNDNINDNINVPEDATEEAPLGAQRDESDLPFSAKENGKQQTIAERAADVKKNKVDDMKVVDNIVGEKTRKAFERLAKMMGANIQWQYSDKLGNGWIQETTDADGNVHRTIFITLDSSITEGAQFIFGHEMTHQIKNLNPAAYNELTQLVLDTYGSDAFDKAVDETMHRYSDAGFSGRTRNYYAEEVVADAVGEMIRDLNLAHTLAMKMSHPLLAAIHEILQKIKLAFFGTEYSDVTKNIIRSIEQAYVKTANGEVTNSETGEDVSFSLRQKPEPKKKGIGYKVFVLKDGKLYPPMVANPDGAATPVGVWLDADAAPIAGESKTGRPQVKQGGKGTQGGSGKLAYRPGWHLGVVPYAIQFNRKDAEGNKTLFPKNFVFAEVEYAADVDYQEEARQEGINPSGKYQHSLAGLKHLPTDGYYMYRTNPNPETDPWVITGAMKVNRILTRAEQAELVKSAGREPQQIQEGDIVTDDVVNSINQEIADAPKFSLKVYHGSGADFTEFDFDHMGEGAGSQVFGWGGYVTSSKKIGKDYAAVGQQSAESRHAYSEDTPVEAAVSAILGQDIYNNQAKTFEQKKAQAIKNAENSIVNFSNMLNNSNELDEKSKKFLKESIEADKKKLEILRTLTEEQYKEEYIKQGRAKNLYEVDIPDDNGSNYLDWDKPLSKKQQDAIREGLEHLGVDIKKLESKGQSLERTGENVYNSTLYIGLTGTEYDLPEKTKGISKFLSSVGFTGIKYKAGRNFGGVKKGDVNYVIFKPEDMKITEHTKFSLRLKSAIEETETNPSDAQKESGNYKKGHIKFGGYDYTIENPKGSTRSGKDADGKEWKVTMHDTYGYIRGKFGKDGDHLDMFINDKADLDNWDGDVFVVDQVNPDGSFDEHKVMYGYDSMDDAKKAYLANYSDGWQGLGNITGASKDEFDKWLDTSNRKLKPFADYAKVKFSLKDIKPVGVGAFGNIYNQFRGKSKAAIEFLKKLGSGEATAALHHHTIGDISLVWGDKKTGLDKILRKHPEVVDNLQSIIDSMEVVQESDNRIKLESPTHFAVVSKEYKGEPREQWLLTAYEKRESLENGKSMDTATSSLGGDTALSQSKESAAKIDNSSETAKENGEKFSLKDEKTLAGVHNITEEKLRKALKLGGFANPSLAVIDTNKSGHNNFGEISFIAPSALLDKRTGKTGGTWITDAYTQRYPSVERQMSEKGSQKFEDWVDSLEYPSAAKAEIKRQTKDVLEDNGVPAWELMYLKEKGIDIKAYDSNVDYRWKEIINDHPTSEDILSSMQNDPELKEKVTSLAKHAIIYPTWEKVSLEVRRKMYKETGVKASPINPQVRKQTKEIFERDYKSTLLNKDGSPRKKDVKKVVEDIVKEHNDTKKYDFYLSKVKASNYVNKNGLYDDYIRWQENKLDEFGTKNRIFRGYTRDGSRKYVPETLENVSKAMREEADGQTNGSEYTSFGSFIAKLASRVDSTDEMRANKDKLSSNKDKEEFYEKWSEVYYDLAKFLYNDVFYGEQRLHDIVLQSDPKKYAKKEYGITLTPTFMKKLDALKNAVQTELKSAYFETKYNRPLRLNEFAAVVVPDNLGEDVRKGIENAGLPMYDYDPNKEGDRSRAFNEAINSSDNIRFSLAGERGAAAADKAEERTFRMDNLSVAKDMEKNKKKAKAIKAATGWERGADGKWRYEMPDVVLRDPKEWVNKKTLTLSDIVEKPNDLFKEYPELFDAYPELKDMKILKGRAKSGGVFYNNAITLNLGDIREAIKYDMDTHYKLANNSLKKTLVHEIQHYIQDKEGFAQGGNNEMIIDKNALDAIAKLRAEKDAVAKEFYAMSPEEQQRRKYEINKRYNDLTKQIERLEKSSRIGYDGYNRLSGEVEARNVSSRLNMTPEERRKTLAESTEDVARKDQIFLGVGDVSFSLRDMADGKESGAADMAEDLKSLNTPDEVDDAIKTAIDDMPSGWQMANKKMIHIAQALGENRKAEIAGEEPKFSLKDGSLIKAGTYFSGGGLVEEGLKGIIDPVVAVEYDEKISGVYRNNFGQHIVTADVRDVDPKELVKQIDGEVEYFHASPVCKNYSQAKSNHAEVELDKETAASTAEFINAVKPKVVTIENVKGYKDSDAMKTITDALDANGYTWDADVYNAADYGGYTNRERLIVRAVRDGKLPAKPKKMAHKSGWYEVVADIIPTLTEKKNGVAPWMDIRLKADGIDWRNIDKPLYVMGSAYADGKVPHAFADELLPTLRTKSGDVIVMPDGKVYRAMGRVLARVSGVSDDYKMPFSENLSHTIIGNGIPTQLTEHVIAPLLTGSDPKFSIRTYHGTGASFDKFDLSHALEGEGSESFGHGVYVTNSSKIGREYAQRAKNRKMEDLYKNMRYPDGVKGDIFKRRVFGEMVNDVATGGSVASAKEFAKKRVGADANDIQRTLENLKDREKGTEYEQNLKDRLAEYKEGLKWIDSLDEDYLTQGNANRYDVDIPDDNGSNYLDWEGTIPDSLDKQKVAEDAYKVVSDNQGFNDFKATPLNDFIAHTLKTYVNTTDVAGRVEKLKSDIKDVIENYVADDDVLALNEYLKDATPDDVLATIWYNDLVRDIKDADLGEELYRKLSTYVGDNAASQILSDNGLVGIKYPAGMIHGGAKEGDYNYVIFDENNANIVGNTRFSLRYDQFEHDLNQWKKDNNLPKDAQRPTIPQRNAGESAVDFLRRVDEYRKQMALWKTAPTYEQHLLSDDTALGEFNRELQRGSVLKRIAFQDSMLAIRKAQEAIMKEVGVDRLNMAEDAYTAENRSHGKGKNEFEEYNNEFLQPLRKAYHQMKKVLGDSYDNVRIYMMAKHGLERDAQMAFKKSLEADYEDVAQRSAAYKAYKGDMNRIINDSDLEFGRVDFTTWRQRDNALMAKYSPSYMDYRYDKNGIVYDYSGLSALFDGSDFEEAAHKLVKDIESKYVAETHNLWDATNAATKKILRDGYKAGMMSKDTYQYVRDMYSHYIPLRGWDGTTADQVWDYIGGGKGAFNQTLKKAHGRTSIADDPIAYIENMAESGILLNNKNWVKQHLMLLAQNHPASLLTLSKAWYVKSVDDNGNEEWIPATPQITSQMDSNQVKAAIDAFEKKMEKMAQTGDATQKRDGLNIAYPQTHSEEREHEVRVMKDGEEYVIYVNGDPQLAQAMNNTRAHRVREIQSGKLDRAAAWLGRKMAAAYTSLSPLFIPSNYFRDLTMTLASTAIREDAKYNYLLRKNLATSWNLGFMLRDYQNGKLRDKVNNGNATPKEQMFYDFMMNGGETGFVSSLDVEDLKKKFKNDLKDLDRWKTNPVKVGHTIMDGIEFLNRAIEDSNRFAVYMTSIQYGRSIDEAVNDAKDVTLNFNRKGTGEYGWQMIRNLYLFINPAVQSLQTLGALAKHHPFKFSAVTASWLASGVLVPIVNAALISMLGGDDDKDKYWQFTKWDRRNNLIMWVPFTHEYIKIPLAQEFRAFYGIGDMIASKMMGGELAEESWSQYAEDLLGQVVDMLPLDPTGYDGNIAVSLMPNAIRPVFELAFNVDFTGKPLFKETEYNKYDPNFTKAYVGTPDWLVRISRMVNSIGNDYPNVQQNSIDAFGDPRYNLNNPAVVDHVLSSYLGGAYTMGSQVLGLLTKSLNDRKEIKVADIPLVSKFVSNPDDRPVSKKQGDEFWDKKEYYDRASNTISKLKKQAKIDGDYSLLERFYGSEEYKTYKLYEKDVKDYKEARKKERAEESGDEYRPHQLNAEDIYNNHATPMDEFEDMKLKQLFEKLNSFKTRYDAIVDNAPNESDSYYNTNKAAIDAIDEISLDKQEISELKKGFLDDGKDAYNAEDMKRIRELRKSILAVLEKANKVVVANQKAKTEK
jgi:site-specific DNA-cytosine methylase